MAGVFASKSKLWTRYRVQMQFRDKVMGGVPKNPKLIEGWLRAKAGITDVEEVHMGLLRTLNDMGADVSPEMSYEDVERAAEVLAGTKVTSGFKRDEDSGLYLESRQLKAMLKEAVNILYAGERVGPTKKGAKSYLAERVFPTPDQLWMDRQEPDGVEMIIGHITGVGGPRSTLGYHEYCLRPTISADILVARDAIPQAWWPDLWELMQENGMGALRSQGYGKFDVLFWGEAE